MVKIVFLVRRSRAATPHELHRRYLAEHVPLALRHHPRLKRYVVNLADSPLAHEDAGTFPDGRPAIDAVGELWFETLEDFTDRTRLFDSPEGEAAIAENARSLGGTALGYLVAEHVVADGPRDWPLGERSPGVKHLALVRRAPHLTHEQFVEQWVRRAAETAAGWKHVVNEVVEPLHPDAPGGDALVEQHFRSADDVPPDPLHPDLAALVSATAGVHVSEYVQKDEG